jgi:hypothetical protein
MSWERSCIRNQSYREELYDVSRRPAVMIGTTVCDTRHTLQHCSHGSDAKTPVLAEFFQIESGTFEGIRNSKKYSGVETAKVDVAHSRVSLSTTIRTCCVERYLASHTRNRAMEIALAMRACCDCAHRGALIAY